MGIDCHLSESLPRCFSRTMPQIGGTKVQFVENALHDLIQAGCIVMTEEQLVVWEEKAGVGPKICEQVPLERGICLRVESIHGNQEVKLLSCQAIGEYVSLRVKCMCSLPITSTQW